MVYFGLFISLYGFHIWAFLLVFVALYFLFWVIPCGLELDFIFFSFVGGLRGAEPSSLLQGHSSLCWFLIAETQSTF